MECWTCLSNSGERRISPGPTIFEGEWRFVEHAFPVKRVGWLVIVLKRHAEAVHELTVAEFTELGWLLGIGSKLLVEELGCEKEYVSCYAEAEHFRHIHFHLFGKPADLPVELRGTGSFGIIKPTEAEAAAQRESIKAFCETMRTKWVGTESGPA